MELHMGTKPFDQAMGHLPERIRSLLAWVPEDMRCRATEIRMRAGGALSLTLPEGPAYLTAGGRVTRLWQQDCIRLSGGQLAEILRCLCDYSIHSYTEDIARGYITLPGGHRAGVCGTAVAEGGTVRAVREISSVNLRIAREIPGASKALCERVFAGSELPGVLIAGAPGSGKTTLLRDLARRLSDGQCAGGCRRVAIVDERGELAGARAGEPCCAVGANTDVLTGYPKGEGILLALRSLAPEIILCDELGGEADATALAAGLYAGVTFVATVHAGSMEEARTRPIIRKLLHSGAFDVLVQLEAPGKPYSILSGEWRVESGEWGHRVPVA